MGPWWAGPGARRPGASTSARRRGAAMGLVAALLVLLAAAGPAPAQEFAPTDRPGPEPSVTQAQLEEQLRCSGDLRGGGTPVLLNPATGVTAEQNYGWNWENALTRAGIAWCAYTAPERTLGDIQVSGEYLVRAIRTVNRRSGRRIAILGHSQGGMSMRWALRFWPDTRAMVDDVVGWAGSNHGTTILGGSGQPRVPAAWQQGADARFIAALNSRAETFAGISYTNVYTRTDQVVLPSTGPDPSSALRTGEGRITNVATQDVCPTAVYEHLGVGTIDPVAYALTLDALTNDGPASPARVGSAPCTQVLQPGVDPTRVQANLAALGGVAGLLAVPAPVNVVGVPTTSAEPPLRCYVFAACPAGTPADTTGIPPRTGGSSTSGPPRCVSRRRFSVRVPRAMRATRATLNGKRLRVRGRGARRTVRIDLRGRPRQTVTLRLRGRTASGKRRTVTRRYRTCTSRG